MTDQLKNILIGLFVVVAITIGVSLTLFLDPTVGDGKKLLEVRFANISGISVGTRVSFGGKVVGEVSAIKEVPDARDLAIGETGKVFLYQLTLKIDSSVKLYTSDEIAIRTTGLMGERSIAILPRLAPKGGETELITNQILYASSADPMESTINQIGKVAHQVQVTIDLFDDWFIKNKETVTSVLQYIDGSLGHVNTLLANINEGKGNLGRFLQSEDVYLRLSSIMGKVDTLMNDVNHYGVLFQYNKSWQKQREKRANAMRALETPREFRDYFEGEVNTIQTSLGRLTELMGRAEDSQERQKIIQSEAFKRDFASLQRQVQGLTDAIRLYNEELVSSAQQAD